MIVFGLPRELRHSMVNEVGRQYAQGLVASDGLRVRGLLEGFDCVLRRVTDITAIDEHFGCAIWYHRSQRGVELTEAYQLVWPSSRTGLYPWDEGCAPEVIARQPALYQPRLNS